MFNGLGSKLERVITEHLLTHLINSLKRDGHLHIPQVGEARLDLSERQLIVDLDEILMQRLRRHN